MADDTSNGPRTLETPQQLLPDDLMGGFEAWHRDLALALVLIASETGTPICEIIADALEQSPLVKTFRLGHQLSSGSPRSFEADMAAEVDRRDR